MKRFIPNLEGNEPLNQSQSRAKGIVFALLVLSAAWFIPNVKEKVYQVIRGPIPVEKKIANLNDEIARLEKVRDEAIKEAEVKNRERGIAFLKSRPPVTAFEKQKVPMAPSPPEHSSSEDPASNNTETAPAQIASEGVAAPEPAKNENPAPQPGNEGEVPTIQFVKKGALASQLMNDEETPTIQFVKKGPLATQIMEEQNGAEESQDEGEEEDPGH